MRLSPRFVALYKTMPRDQRGNVLSIKYIPDNERKAYAKQWRAWAAQHPKSDWDPWLVEYMGRYDAAKAAYKGKSAAIRHDPVPQPRVGTEPLESP